MSDYGYLLARVQALEAAGGTSVPPPTFPSTGLPSSFTDHPGGAPVTVVQVPDGICISGPAFGSDNINTVLQTYPTPPFVLKAQFYLMQAWSVGISGATPQTGDCFGGLAIRNVAGNIQAFGLLNSLNAAGVSNDAQTFVINWTNSTTAATGPAQAGTWSPSAALALSDNGTTLTYYYSLNPDAVQNSGYKWHQVYQVAKASNFITAPNQIGIFGSMHISAGELVMTRWMLALGTATP
jgi:hypothetical protein